MNLQEPSPRPAQRDFYIDRLRTIMTALVLLHHVAITYGGSGGWFWRELPTDGSPSSTLLTLFCATNQAYFMGFFFLLAGFYTPRSLEKKGFTKFICDRFLRLGLPLLFFILVLGPVTAAIVTWFRGDGFWPTIQSLYMRLRIINGPLWFAQALLIFALGYSLWRVLFGSKLATAERNPSPIPAAGLWLISALGVAAVSISVRLVVPVGQNFFGLQLAYFPGYIFLFAVGIAAWRHDWLSQLSWKQARPWIINMAIAWPTLPIGILMIRSQHLQRTGSFNGGLTWSSILYALWEPFVAWGAICLWLLVFRAHMNQPSAFWDWLNRRAFAVYIIHPAVLVTIALLLHPWTAPALVKFLVTGTLTILATWLLADPIVRIPGVRKVV